MVVSSFEIDENGNPVEVLRDLEDLSLFGLIPEYTDEEIEDTQEPAEKEGDKKC